MGCDVAIGGASRSECAAIEQLFEARNRTFSRFRHGSELNRVNAAAGAPVRVSRDFAAMLGVALGAARETGGLVVPTLGAQLEAAGYDRDFALLTDDAAVPAAQTTLAAVRLDGRWVTVPRGVRLDLNGVVKGRTVDDAVALLPCEGFVAAGGDLAVRGTLVAELPHGGTVRLVRGALATSGTDRRRWLRGGRQQHHLIDPRTGTPSSSPWEQVTVCGLTCVGADVAAKAAFLLGSDGPAWLDARGLPGRFVGVDGAIVANRAWQATVEWVGPCI